MAFGLSRGNPIKRNNSNRQFTVFQKEKVALGLACNGGRLYEKDSIGFVVSFCGAFVRMR